MSNGEFFNPDSDPPWDSSVQFELDTPPESVVPPEETDVADWPPEVDAQGREMPATGMWKIEPLPPLFNKDGSLTKTGYFALLSEDPLEFPLLPGYSPPPVEWVREAWDIEYFRDFFVRELARGVSKCGSFDLTDEVRLVLSEALTTEQVVKFFLDLRGEGDRELEFRPEFEKVFAKHAQFLPPLCMDEWIDANCPELRYWGEPLPDNFVDWPPEVDAHGNEISPFATRVPDDEAFLKQKELTKKDYFALICADPWRFPDVEGFPPVPNEWASEAWDLPEFQDNFVSCLRNEVSKTGDVGLNRFSEILTLEQVIALYHFFMETCCTREEEFRPCFEKAFPKFLPFLPPPLTREGMVRSLRQKGLSRRQAIWCVEFDGTSTPSRGCPFVEIRIETSEIKDWGSFHDLFIRVFGFNESYGRNMDAWTQYLSSLDDPEDDLTSVKIPFGSVVVLELQGWQGLAERHPDIYTQLLEGTAFVNQERLSIGLGPLLCLSVSGGRRY